MSGPRDRTVVADAAELGAAAAARVAAHALRALGERGAFRLAVPGGRTVAGMFAALAAPPHRDAIDWPRVTVFLADERAVPAAHADSNARCVHDALLAPLGARAPRIVRPAAEEPDLDAAAAAYAAVLVPALDLVVLGLGEDGHVASLFPGSALLAERTRRAAAVTGSPKPPARRITLTPLAIDEAAARLLLASGDGKAAALAAVLAAPRGARDVPAACLAGGEWIVDRAAAGA